MKTINKLLTFFASGFVLVSSFSCGGGKTPPPEPPAHTPTIVHANISEGDAIKFEYEGEDDLLVDWGDGTTEDAHSTEHTYSESKDDVKVEITGTITSIRFSSWSGFGDNRHAIRGVELSDTITKLPAAAFNGLNNMSKIVLSNSIINIEDYAFSSCDGLSEINIPKSVISLGGTHVFEFGSQGDDFTIYCAAESKPEGWPENWNFNHPFYWDCLSHGEEDGFVYFNTNRGIKIIKCNITNDVVNIPETLGGLPVAIIGKDVFNASVTQIYNYTTINMPSSIKIIEDNAFNDCINLEEMIIPLATATIGENVFSNCVGLTAIYCEVPSKPDGWSDNWNCGHTYYWDYVSHGEENDFKYLTTNHGSYVLGRTNAGDTINIPDTLGGKPVVGINDEAFVSCGNISSLTMPDSIQSIGERAFAETNLSSTNFVLPNSLVTIGTAAFQNSRLNEIIIPSKVTSIGKWPFATSGISVSVYCKVESQPDGWDEEWHAGVDHYYWDYVSRGEQGDFAYVTSHKGSELVKYNGYLLNIDVPETLGGMPVIAIGNSAFTDNQYNNITLPNSVETIRDNAFYGCEFTSFVLPASLKTIEKRAFYNCQLLKEIIIPKNVLTIKEEVFTRCSPYFTIYCEAESEQEGWVDGWNCEYPFCLDYVSRGEEKGFSYLCLNHGSYVTGCVDATEYSINIPDTLGGKPVVGIADGAFQYRTITSLVMPNSIQSIGSSAFRESDLSSVPVTLPLSLKSIGADAFLDCLLGNIKLPSGVTSIGEDAFWNNNLKELDIPESVVSVGTFAFYFNNELTVYCEHESKPDEWSTTWDYGIYATYWGVINHGVTDNKLKYITTNDGTKIVEYSGEGGEIVIPDTLGDKSVVEINGALFQNNSLITSVKLPNTLKTIGEAAFNNCSNLGTIDLTDFTDPFADLPNAHLNAFTDTNCIFNVASKAMALSFAFEGGGWPSEPNRYFWPQ